MVLGILLVTGIILLVAYEVGFLKLISGRIVMKRVTVTMDKLPKSVLELKSEAEKMHSPEGTAILTIAALCLYPENRDESLAMLDYLRGPRPLSIAEKQFIRDRFMDKDYVPRSYFKGATPDNDYTPDLPYELEVID